MKHKHLKHLFTALLLLCTTVASAHQLQIDGIFYNYLSKVDKTLVVTYQGSYWNTVTNDYIGHVTIPETVTIGNDIYTVVAIGESAFAGCENVTGVTLPRTIKSIGTAGFGVNEAETDFTSVYISDLAAWCNIDFASIASNPLSHAENFYLNGELLTEIVIPEGAEEIKSFAFYGLGSNVVNITIPSSIKKIGEDAFRGSVIKNVHISDLAAWCNIDFTGAYSNPLTNAENLYLNGESVNCIIIPEGVTEIKPLVFSGNSFIESISIPASTVSIASNAFQNCANLVNITVADDNTTYDSRENCNAIIETVTNKLFFGCKNSAIPNGVEIIGNRAFAGCGALHIEIPNSVTTIEEYAFYNCANLASVTISNSVKSIGVDAFGHCTSLKSVAIPSGVKSIESYTFYNCKALANVTIPESVTSIGSNSFENCTALQSITIPSGVTTINYNAFYNCSNLKWVYNNSALKIDFNTNNGYIGSYANSIIVPSDDVQGDYVFRTTNGAHTLIAYTGNETDLTLPENYKGENYSIGKNVFKNSSNLKRVVISDGVTSVGTYAFKSCNNLAEITIGKNVAKIEDYAFSSCSRLVYVINKSSLNIKAGASTHGNVAYNASVVILGSDDIQGDYVFRTTNGVHSLVAYLGNETDLTLPESYNGKNYTIGADAFKNKPISSITIPECVTSIGNNAFYGCSKLQTVYNNSALDIVIASTANGYVAYYAKAVIAKGDNVQGDYVFRIIDNHPTLVGYLGNDTDIKFPDNYYGGIYAIGDNLFRGNTQIKSITIPNGITGIGSYAFYNCSNLKSVVNFSNLTFTKGNTGYGYIAYYANNVVNAPNGSVEGDFVFGIIDGVNTLVKCNSVGSSLEDWTSTNKTNNSSSSKTYTLMAKEGDVLTFDWMVSSEGGCDEFFVTINGVQILQKSGEKTGSYEYVFTADGEYVLVARYKKDSSDKSGKDCAKIYNIVFSGATTVDVVLPESYKGEDYVIGAEVFSNCNLGNITIPAAVTGIGEKAFYGCTALVGITSGIAAENLFVPGTDAFTGVDKAKCTLYVPRRTKATYLATEVWNEFENIVELIISNITITINQYGNATYCSEYALDFSNVDGLKAYAATGYNKVTQVVTLTRVQTAHEGTGLFLTGEPGEYTVPVIEYSNDYTLNLLVGTLEQTTVNSTDGAMSNYKFTILPGDEAPMFYPFEDNTPFSAGKAYLQIPTAWLPSTAQRSLSIRFDDGKTTDIDELFDEVKGENGKLNGVCYDMQGRVVENPTSGIYIIDGKKVVIK